MWLIKKARNLKRRIRGGVYRKTYSQIGEDVIIRFLLKIEFGIPSEEIKYLDIGANDPKFINNTYLLYSEGGRGILVEPNPKYCKKIAKVRKRDVVLNYGVASCNGTLTYYMMNADSLNSFSKEEVDEYIKLGYQVVDTKNLPVITANQILEKYGKVHFISLDVEGLDFDILKSIDFNKYAPICICIETCEYKGLKRKDFEEINLFLQDKGYMIYADTMLNTIYVKEKEYISSRKC